MDRCVWLAGWIDRQIAGWFILPPHSVLVFVVLESWIR